jgi:hypothetical protein
VRRIGGADRLDAVTVRSTGEIRQTRGVLRYRVEVQKGGEDGE